MAAQTHPRSSRSGGMGWDRREFIIRAICEHHEPSSAIEGTRRLAPSFESKAPL